VVSTERESRRDIGTIRAEQKQIRAQSAALQRDSEKALRHSREAIFKSHRLLTPWYAVTSLAHDAV
jgi:hypothetical protein